MKEKKKSFDWRASEQQSDFIHSDAFEVLFHGGRGGGKTEAMVMKCLLQIYRGYGYRYCAFFIAYQSEGLNSMFETCARFVNLLFPNAHAHIVKSPTKRIDFKTGEQIHFTQIPDAGSVEKKLKGRSVTFLAFDELSNWQDDEVYSECLKCLRAGGEEVVEQIPFQVVSTTNPRDSALWVWERFIENNPTPGRALRVQNPLFNNQDTRTNMVLEGEKGSEGEDEKKVWEERKSSVTRVHYHTTVFDNKAVLKNSPHYVELLASTGDADEVAATLHGKWVVRSQSPFAEVWKPEHLIIPPFVIPKGWLINITYDYGTKDPFSIGWWAESDGSHFIDQAGKKHPTKKGWLFRIDEWYGGKHTRGKRDKGLRLLPDQVARRVAQINKAYGAVDIIIDSAQTSAEDEIAIFAPFINEGFRVRGCNKGQYDRESSFRLMRYFMAGAIKKDKHAVFIFSHCHECIRQIPKLRWDQSSTRILKERPDTTGNDHLYDEFRTRIMETNIKLYDPAKILAHDFT